MAQKDDFAADKNRHSSFLEWLWNLVCANIAIPNVKALMKQHGQLLNLSEAEAIIALPPLVLSYHRGKNLELHLEAAFEKYFRDSCNCESRVRVLLISYKPLR